MVVTIIFSPTVINNNIYISSSTVTVYINVKDVNDNSPEFRRSTYTTSVLEDVQVGAGILDLEAKDLDSGDNGRILYSIIGEFKLVYISELRIICIKWDVVLLLDIRNFIKIDELNQWICIKSNISIFNIISFSFIWLLLSDILHTKEIDILILKVRVCVCVYFY